MNYCKTAFIVVLQVLCISAHAQITSKPSFKVVPLGVKGGSDESNLSSYMLAAAGSKDYICLDAGTLHYGIQKAIDAKIFRGAVTTILKNNIKGYLISHPHLDHVAGLIINSPDDTSKNIYALPFCTEVLKEKYFSWKSWANFADDGEKPVLNKYHYKVLAPEEETPIAHTSLAVTAFQLTHSNPYKSTAFLIRSSDAYLLYLGDTGADTTEHTNNLQLLWQRIAPLIKEKKLKAIFIEVSFDNAQPDKLLFGHLTPRLLMQEMDVLAGLTGLGSLSNFPIVITHEKPGGNRENLIKKQLLQLNHHKLHLIFPRQATVLSF
ncbi:MAG TPA: 3',5'-cyclic-nucleotide phosphodiesterase [Chitinophagaceae bacterium]|nr:3',5'-cyclic-nucleotide phosphodiesterase [Chitinophagaceae bacterium]